MIVATFKPCEIDRCDQPARPGERFCKLCRRAVIADLKRAGYLRRTPSFRIRAQGKCELTHETKRGCESPWLANAVRALEERYA